jgi:hypothetical protein
MWDRGDQSVLRSPPNLRIPPWVAALPKADLHVHAETDARLDRVLARREGRAPYDWRHWAERLRAEMPPGMPRLARLAADRRREQAEVDAIDAAPENVIARVVDLLSEGAADGAILIEVRFGRPTLQQPELMALFREAERRVREQYPRLRAAAVISGLWPPAHDPDSRLLQSCIAAGREGLAGIDLIPTPYDSEADWTSVSSWVAAAADAGLGITAHVGEFSPANISAALRLPGLRRLGHAVYAAADDHLLEQVADAGVTVECALTCNVVLGAVQDYESHSIRQFMAHGIPVVLGTDDPVRVATTIGREYAVAATLGFSQADLINFTRNAIKAAFVGPERQSDLFGELQQSMVTSD